MQALLRLISCASLLIALIVPRGAVAMLLSYPTGAIDAMGVTGAGISSLGPPDYQFINDVGLGYGGTSTDVFDVGEVVEFIFPVALRNHAAQHDLIVYAFVGGLGETDDANVQVEASSDGVIFAIVDSFSTSVARDPHNPGSPYSPEEDYDGVKHFQVEFGSEDFVTRIRLTNLAGGTSEGLRLDAIEGLHPVVGDDHAFEIRLDRRRPIGNDNFFVRIKNLGDVGGVAIRELRMTRSPSPSARLDDTEQSLFVALTNQGNGIAGESFVCVEHCIPNNGAIIPFARHAWSLDGLVEAPAGLGLAPGRQASNQRSTPFDTDSANYLSGMTFRVTFTDGLVHDFSYDGGVSKAIGSLYQKYPYFDDPPAETGNRQVDYYQGLGAGPIPIQVPTLYAPLSAFLAGLLILMLALWSACLRALPSAGDGSPAPPRTRSSTWFRIFGLAFGLYVAGGFSAARADLLSYPTTAIDTIGVTGAADSALGAADYQFINDVGLGFGGTSSEVFAVGEAVELGFPVPLRNIPGQHDLIISAFVGGIPATDNANVQVEVSDDGINFVIVATFDTEEARDAQGPSSPYVPEEDFDGVKHFIVDFAAEDLVTHVRLTNLAGTVEGLRLDAVEGLHPVVGSSRAFEIRFERFRPDFNGRFFVRIKNIADVGGLSIREFRMTRSQAPSATLEDTDEPLYAVLDKRGNGVAGESFICVENCIPDNGPLIPFSRHAWSVDGLVEAPIGIGLAPGMQASQPRGQGAFDTDNTDYMAGMTFRVTFSDGAVHDFSYDDDVDPVVGSLYQKYLYFDSTPSESWNRPTGYYQFVSVTATQVPTLSTNAYWILAALIATMSAWMIRVRAR